ncbi:hypothetical protein TSUD_36420, partial [Trifolium subterraneum]
IFPLSTLDADAPFFLRKRTRNSLNEDSNKITTTLTRRGFSTKQVAEDKKIVTATKKGAAVLDQWLPDHIKTQYHVLQLAKSDDGGNFLIYTRWGRVGKKGQDKLHDYSSRESAIYEFKQKFLAKTKNDWSHRKKNVFYPKSYVWLETDYSGKEEESTVKESPSRASRKQPQKSKLEPRIAKLISLVCNLSMMNQQMMEIG